MKKLITKSSIDIVKAISIPAKIPGFICGSTIFLRVYKGVAPKSKAASSMLVGICFNFGSIDNTT